MSTAIINEQYLTNIANAIRTKNGEQTRYKPSEMSNAILAIPTGGGGVEEKSDYLNFVYPFSTKLNTNYINVNNAITNDSMAFYDNYSGTKCLESYTKDGRKCYAYIKVDARDSKAKISFKTPEIFSYNTSGAFGVYYTTSIPSEYPNDDDFSNWTVGQTNTYGTLLAKQVFNNSQGANYQIDDDFEIDDEEFYLVYGIYSRNDNLSISSIIINISNSNVYVINKDTIPNIIIRLQTIRQSEPEAKIILNECFSFADLNNSTNKALLQQNKSLFKNILGFKCLFAGYNSSESGMTLDLDLSFLTIDKNTISMANMFEINTAGFLNSIILPNFKTQNVFDFTNAFGHIQASNIDLDVSNINTCNALNLSNMFYYNVLRDLYLGSLDTSKCSDFSNMFSMCEIGSNPSYYQLDISNFVFSDNCNMSNMFSSYNGYTVKLPKQVYNNCNMAYLFESSQIRFISFDGMDIKPEYTNGMFYGCSNISMIDLSNFDTRNTKSVDGMFGHNSSLTSLTLGANFKVNNTEYIYCLNDLPACDLYWYADNFSDMDNNYVKLYLTNWDDNYSNTFSTLANSLGENTTGHDRTIYVSQSLYDAISPLDMAIITGNNYIVAVQ